MSATPGTITRVTPAAILAAGITFPILGMIASALRFYTRKLQKARLMTDDYLIIPALVRNALKLSSPTLTANIGRQQILTTGMGISLIVGGSLR